MCFMLDKMEQGFAKNLLHHIKFLSTIFSTISFYIRRYLTLYRCKPFLTKVLQTLNKFQMVWTKKQGWSITDAVICKNFDTKKESITSE